MNNILIFGMTENPGGVEPAVSRDGATALQPG